jgi:hypothetical protein
LKVTYTWKDISLKIKLQKSPGNDGKRSPYEIDIPLPTEGTMILAVDNFLNIYD